MGFLKRLLGGGNRGNRPDAASLDAFTIAEVRKRAADMAAPRDTNHYLYFPAEEAARTAADAVRRPTRNVTIRPAATGRSWLVLVNEEMVVNEATIAEARREFSEVVAAHGGEYDGWEAAAS